MIEAASTRYFCPGENQPIEPAIHFGRLAAGDPRCRGCPHQNDTGSLPRRTVTQLRQVFDMLPEIQLFNQEGVVGRFHNEIHAAVTRRVATALAAVLREDAARVEAPRVILSHDGRTLTGELAVAAIEGLRLYGCHVLVQRPGTSAQLARKIVSEHADGGLYIGNRRGTTGDVGIRLFGAEAKPFSASGDSTGKRLFGGSLDLVQQAYQQPPSRPVRHFGRLSRITPSETTTPKAQSPRRPLSIVFDTANAWLRQTLGGAIAAAGHYPLQLHVAEIASQRRETAIARIGLAVGQQQADLGAWIDGDGEQCQWVDAQGQPATAELVSAMLMTDLPGRRPVVVMEPSTPKAIVNWLRGRGHVVRRGHQSREATFIRLQETGAAAGGGPSGLHWTGGTPPLIDAAETVFNLLATLSATNLSLADTLDRIRCEAYDL